MNELYTEEQEFDILGRLDAVLLEVLLDEFGTGDSRPLLGRHGASHFQRIPILESRQRETF